MDYRELALEFIKIMENSHKLRRANPQKQIDESLQ